MKSINLMAICLMLILTIISTGCHHELTYRDTQNRFAYDPSFRLGKWYSISDTTGDSQMGINSLLDTIWFINDTLAGWTGFIPYQPHEYAFFKTYIEPKSITNLIYIAPNVSIPGKMDTDVHQFGFTPIGDTLTIYWDFTRSPPLVEQYLKKK